MAFDGLVSKRGAETIASTTTISPKREVVYVTGTEAIATIVAPFGGQFGLQITLIPVGAFTTVTTGNIGLASTAVAAKALNMTYLPATGKWYPSY